MWSQGCIDDEVSKAKCCVADRAMKYIIALNYGEVREDQWLYVDWIVNIIESLERYQADPDQCVGERKLLSEAGIVLADSNKFLSLGCSGEKICNADSVNCLSESDVRRLLEQLSLFCNDCNCNC